jgi:hypothetical protein
VEESYEMKRRRKPEDTRKEFDTQWRLLTKSCDEFDRGDQTEAKRIAVALRILLHHGGQSHSLLHQVGLADVLFFDSAEDVDRRNLLPTFGLTQVALHDSGAAYVAPGPASLPLGRPIWLIPFKYWWTKAVISMPGDFDLTRKDLVLTMANQNGGAHVDPELEERYYRLTREKLGAYSVVTESGPRLLEDIESVSVRQIAQEVRVSLVASHRTIPSDLPPELSDEDWRITFGSPRPIGPNGEPFVNMCPCHSGLEYKVCHMKGAPNEGKSVPPVIP